MTDLNRQQFHRANVRDTSVASRATQAHHNKVTEKQVGSRRWMRNHMENDHHTSVSHMSDEHAFEEHGRQHRAARLYGDALEKKDDHGHD